MLIDLAAVNFSLTAAIERHVEGRVRAAIGRASRSLTGVMVRLRDINGKRRGIDKACRIVVWVRNGGAVVVEAIHRDLYAAIDAAGLKLRESLWRRLRRQRTLQRKYLARRFRSLD